MIFFFWPTPSKIGQFEQKWPINWPSGIPEPMLGEILAVAHKWHFQASSGDNPMKKFLSEKGIKLFGLKLNSFNSSSFWVNLENI